MRFNLPTIPAGCSLTAASLKLFARAFDPGRTINVYLASVPWAEGTSLEHRSSDGRSRNQPRLGAGSLLGYYGAGPGDVLRAPTTASSFAIKPSAAPPGPEQTYQAREGTPDTPGPRAQGQLGLITEGWVRASDPGEDGRTNRSVVEISGFAVILANTLKPANGRTDRTRGRPKEWAINVSRRRSLASEKAPSNFRTGYRFAWAGRCPRRSSHISREPFRRGPSGRRRGCNHRRGTGHQQLDIRRLRLRRSPPRVLSLLRLDLSGVLSFRRRATGTPSSPRGTSNACRPGRRAET